MTSENNNLIEIVVPGSLEKGILLSRENRFIAFVKYKNKSIRCHLPNPGRMVEFLHSGSTVYIRFSDNPKRKTEATLVAIECDGELIQLDSNLVSRIIPAAVGKIDGLKRFSILKNEITVGKHRYDFLFDDDGTDILVEIKSTTRVINGTACFPDAVSTRAQSHLFSLHELSKIRKCMIIFMVYRQAKRFTSCKDIDPTFSNIFDKVKTSEVSILVFQCFSKIISVDSKKYLAVNIGDLIPLN